MKLYAGTSGFSYKEWKGSFYPEDLPSSKMLSYYAERFPAVEINNTFYRMPTTASLERWAQEVPPGFRFILKASRRISHIKRLKDVDDSVEYLLKTTATLGERLGPLLFQLPPFLKKDTARLANFLDLLPAERRAAFEFRHASWFDEEVYDVLRSHGVALCVADSGEDEEVPLVATCRWGYLRLRRPEYGEDGLDTWARRIHEQDWDDVFVFFKHEDEGAGPKLTQRFIKLFEG